MDREFEARAAPRIVLIGATGYTGRLVAHELARRGAPFLLTARDADRVERLAEEVGDAPTGRVDVAEPGTVAAALRPRDVVINCAGPFTDLGEPVVRAAVERGAHYIDTTGEQRFMMEMWRRWHRPSLEAGVSVVNSMAFEYVLGDLGAVLAAEALPRPLRSVDAVYRTGGEASRGTRRSALRVLGRRGYAYRRGEWQLERPAARWRRIRLVDGDVCTLVSFPAGEIVTLPRHIEVREVSGWMVMPRRMAILAHAISPVLPPLIRLTRPMTERLLAGAREGPSEAERESRAFTIQVDAIGADGTGRAVRIRGNDAYGVTAAIAAAGARRLLAGGAPAGVIAPAELVDPRDFLERLLPHGVTWRSMAIRRADG